MPWKFVPLMLQSGHWEVPDWTWQQMGTRFRNAQVRIRVEGKRMGDSSSDTVCERRDSDPHECFRLSMTCMGWNTMLVNFGSVILSTLPQRYDPLAHYLLWNIRDLAVTFVPTGISINMGLLTYQSYC